MYHLHMLIHMSYVYLQICLTRQSNTTIIKAPFLGSGCGRVFQGAGRKAKRMVLQCINGVSSNPVEGRTKILQLKNLILTLFGLIFCVCFRSDRNCQYSTTRRKSTSMFNSSHDTPCQSSAIYDPSGNTQQSGINFIFFSNMNE